MSEFLVSPRVTDASVFLSIIVPVYHEEKTLESFLYDLKRVLRDEKESYEILFVDDGSSDGTWAALAKLQQKEKSLRALRLSRNFGKEAAVAAGIQAAQGRLCLVMDGDHEHPPELIPVMLQKWRETGANVVEGVKQRAYGEGWLSRKSAAIFYRLFHTFSGLDLGGETDFKLFDQEVRLTWLRLQERNPFFRGLIAWMGYRHEKVPFQVPTIQGRKTRWRRTDLVQLAIKSITSFSTAPLQLVTSMGLLFFIFAVILGIQTIYNWLIGGALEGFATVILLQLIQGSATMFGLGMIGLYLARISEEVKSRPRFIVSERLGD